MARGRDLWRSVALSQLTWCCGGCGRRVQPAEGVGVHGGALRLLTAFLPMTQGGDVLLHVMAVSALRCQFLFPEHLGHLRRLPRVLDLGLLRLVQVQGEKYTCTPLRWAFPKRFFLPWKMLIEL